MKKDEKEVQEGGRSERPEEISELDRFDTLELLNEVTDETEGLAFLKRVLGERYWFSAYYYGLNKKSLIRFICEHPAVEHLCILPRVEEGLESPVGVVPEKVPWGRKVSYWKRGGLMDHELFIADGVWKRDGELKGLLRDSKPMVLFLMGDAATQTEQSHYTWKRGSDFLIGHLKPLYRGSANRGERIRLVLAG